MLPSNIVYFPRVPSLKNRISINAKMLILQTNPINDVRRSWSIPYLVSHGTETATYLCLRYVSTRWSFFVQRESQDTKTETIYEAVTMSALKQLLEERSSLLATGSKGHFLRDRRSLPPSIGSRRRFKCITDRRGAAAYCALRVTVSRRVLKGTSQGNKGRLSSTSILLLSPPLIKLFQLQHHLLKLQCSANAQDKNDPTASRRLTRVTYGLVKRIS